VQTELLPASSSWQIIKAIASTDAAMGAQSIWFATSVQHRLNTTYHDRQT
jgi:hypothetical protein